MRRFYRCDEGFQPVDNSTEYHWIDILEPDSEETQYLEEELKVPPMFMEYLKDADERPRVEREGAWLMTIVLIPATDHVDGMPYKTVPCGIISCGNQPVITLCYYKNRMMEDFADPTRHLGINVDNVPNFTLRVFFSAASWYLRCLRNVANIVLGQEKNIDKAIKNDELIKLMRLQKSLVYFSTSIKGNLMVLERVCKMNEGNIDQDLAEDVQIELRQADATASIYTEILDGTMDSYASIISNNVNSVMKRMSGISIILIVPTFVASLFGMNVNILLGDVPYAFWIIIGIAAVLTVLAFLLLRRVKWF